MWSEAVTFNQSSDFWTPVVITYHCKGQGASFFPSSVLPAGFSVVLGSRRSSMYSPRAMRRGVLLPGRLVSGRGGAPEPTAVPAAPPHPGLRVGG